MSKDISSLSPEVLSRWIAEHNEPLKTLPNAAAVVAVFSPLRSWIIKGSRDESWCDVRWVPRPYTDPEICLRLWKALIERGYVQLRPDTCIVVSAMSGREFRSTALSTEFERATAEAYALANGYRPEGGK